jgi:hypothetical protein
MRAAMLAVLLCGCGGHDKEPPVRKQPTELATTAAPPDAKPAEPAPPVDIAALVPAKPAAFGPWAAFPIGTPLADVRRTNAALLDGSFGVSPSSYEVGADGKRPADDATLPRFGVGVAAGRIAAHTIVLDANGVAAVEAAWGPPAKLTDAHGRSHTLWATDTAHFELTWSGDSKTLIATDIVPLAHCLGEHRFAFEPDHSLVGLSAAAAVGAIERWAKANHLPISSEGDAAAMTRAIAGATGADVTPDRVVVVGDDGSTTPLSAMPVRSLDVELPPTESSFEKLEYNVTRLRLWFDDKGVVDHYWFDLFILDDAHYAATTALLAKTFGKPKRKGASLYYPSKPPVCFPATPVQYASIEVGACR